MITFRTILIILLLDFKSSFIENLLISIWNFVNIPNNFIKSNLLSAFIIDVTLYVFLFSVVQ